MPNWWRVKREGCTCTIDITDVASDGTVERGCVDDDCRCQVDACGCERRAEEHVVCCDDCDEPLCMACRLPMTQCEAVAEMDRGGSVGT